MSEDETVAAPGVAGSLWFWAGTVVLLAPLAMLLLHRAGAPPAPRSENISSDPIQQSVVQTPQIAAELAESQRLLDAGQPEASLVVIRRALAIESNSAAAQNNLCVALGLLKDRRQAVAACMRALEIDPDYEPARKNLRWVTSLSMTRAAQ
jgi:Flp pilus assembly protein TadD